jgi:hypothetical protein
MEFRSSFKLFAFLSLGLAGCTPHIGDKCVLSTDCSLRGDRLCDNSQPNGYCTVFNCTPDTCPDTAACVLFHPNVPGCPYSDRDPSRTGRTFCMARCQSDSDCRTDDGYICADPRQTPWDAIIVDDDQSQHVCIVRPDNGQVGGNATMITDAAVCNASGPAVPPISIDATPAADATASMEGGGADAPPPPDANDDGG